jgi:hypothetical protein
VNDTTDDEEGEPNHEWSAKMYTMELLLTEPNQLEEADTGELRNMRPSIEKMQFIINFKRIINSIVNRFCKTL